LRRLELSEDDLYAIHTHARHLRLLAIATPFSPTDVPVCDRLGLDAIKIASPDIVNFPLLEAARETGKPLLLSTGAATLEEIDATHASLGDFYPRCYLHCISSYPTPDDQAHLTFIPQLIQRYANHEAVGGVGYSDHAQSLLSGAFAVAAGATILERHLTYDKKAQGPDHAASSDPREFAEYVKYARQATTLRGTGPKRVLPIEQDVRKVSRQSLVLTQDTPAGVPLTKSHRTPHRPGTGIPAAAYPKLLGRTLHSPQKANTLLTWDMLST
jgi:sialic acid synthase SpsE